MCEDSVDDFDEFDDDYEDFDDDEMNDEITQFDSARDYTEEMLIEQFGERCDSFEESCEACKRWAAFDILFEDIWADDREPE